MLVTVFAITIPTSCLLGGRGRGLKSPMRPHSNKQKQKGKERQEMETTIYRLPRDLLVLAEGDGDLPHGHNEHRYHALPHRPKAVIALQERKERQRKCHLHT